LHHHSFAYLDRRSMPARLLMRLGGSSATHVALCESQRQRLRRCYGVSRTRVVSNAAIMAVVGTGNRTRSRVERIGFLGNISREKGINEVMAVAERLARQGTGIELYIAGPFENVSVEKAVQNAVARLDTTKYLGPRYGMEKESFWELIDVLLFPSKYSNETAPLVVYEAMAHGVPVIAWERGCLCDMMSPTAGILVSREEDFVAVAVEQLLAWQRDPAVFTEVSKAAAKQCNRQREKHGDSLESLLDEFCPRRPACSYSHADGVSSY